MASALARVGGSCCRTPPGQAEALVQEVGGEAVATNAELAERADAIVLCHKPGQLGAVAAQVGGNAQAVVSILRRDARRAAGRLPAAPASCG